MFVKPFKMKMITLRRLFWIFLFLLVFYAIYLLFVNTSFEKFNELHYQPVNYRNFRQMSRLKARNERLAMNSKLKSSKLYKEIDCIINDDEYKISCLKSTVNQNVFLPFYFVKNYFDVYGSLVKPDKLDGKERETFHFQHSYSKVYLARERYDYRKKFLFFEYYSVENRQRVKYVSGLYSVPVSTQWNSMGHLYPIQICQYGLSSYSKMLANDQPKFIYLDTDKYAKNDLSDLKGGDLKVGETETLRNDLKEEPKKEDEQLSIDQLTNLRNDLNSDLVSNDFNQSLNEEPAVPKKLKRRKVIRLEDNDKRSEDGQSDEQVEQQSTVRRPYDEPNSQSMNEESAKNRTIFLNNTSLVLTLNLTKRSAFYNSLFLTFRYRLVGNVRITVVLMNDNRTKFKVNYRNINSELLRNDNLVYGLGNSSGWRLFARNVGVDLIKSLNLSRKKNLNNGLKLKNLHLYRVIINGEAVLDEIKLSSNGHFYAFANSVIWLLAKQDENGGWPSKVNKRLVSSSLVLNVNWHSSMAQGHGISLLMRAFHFRNEFNLLDGDHLADLPERNASSPAVRPSRLVNDELARMKLKTKLNSKLMDRSDERLSSDNSTADDVNYFIDPDRLILNNSLIYLNAAIDAVNLFKKNVTENGISAYFVGQYRFYEEFPTTPSLFVLNGFVYSLFGLYDLKMTLNLLIRNQKLDEPLNDYYLVKLNEVDQLFDDGVRTLKTLLPLFDTGSRSLYDLRHFTLQNQPPNLSRWDYHSVHINLLSHLNTILNDPNIDDTVQRWIGYMKGKRAAHN